MAFRATVVLKYQEFVMKEEKGWWSRIEDTKAMKLNNERKGMLEPPLIKASYCPRLHAQGRLGDYMESTAANRKLPNLT